MSVAARAIALAARGLTSLPPAALVRMSGRPAVRIDGQTLEPEVQLALSLLDRIPEEAPERETPEQARAGTRLRAGLVTGAQVAVKSANDLIVDSGAMPIPARLYEPEPAPEPDGGAPPLLVYFHGGGYVAGDLDTHDNLCRLICRAGNMLVLSVDYRLAPEHPFPAAIEDGRAAFDWALAHAEQLGADPARVAVGGDSAGGGLASVVARRGALDGTRPAAQLLIYPVTDISRDWPSYEKFAEGFFLSRAQMHWYANHYIGSGDRTDPDASPLLAPDLSGLPPALVVTAGFDVLRDEGEAYAQRLREAGNDVSLRRFPGQIHGFVNAFGISPASRDALLEIIGATRALFS